MARTVIATVPERFYDDHVERDLPAGRVVKALSKNRLRVELDREAYDDLLSDARHYADPEGFDWNDPFMRGVILSAKATVRALEKVERPDSAQVELSDEAKAHIRASNAAIGGALIDRLAKVGGLSAAGVKAKFDRKRKGVK